MPSESVASFLDLAKSNRLLPADQVEDLSEREDVPNHSLAALCDFLLDRGSITPYQAERIRSGSGAELNFAGYPMLAELGPCPGGVAYKALHPSLRTPIVLRRLRASWLAPADDVAAYVGRAQDACPVTHAHLAHLLDAGVFQEEPFVAFEAFDGANLRTLVTDIGAMPAILAVGYGRQIALGLQAAHERGQVHGDVRPTNVLVGPLVPMAKPRADGTPRFRPGPTAVVKVLELGLVPRRPPAVDWIAADSTVEVDEVAYLAPERFSANAVEPAGDVYGLGATLYFLMTGRAPYLGATSAEVATAVAEGSFTPLESLRPDLGAYLIALVAGLMNLDSTTRPTTAEAVAALGVLVGIAPPSPPVKVEPPSPIVVPDDGAGGEDMAPLESVMGEADVTPLEVEPTDEREVDSTPVTLEGVPSEVGDFIAEPPAAPPGGWVVVPYQGEAAPAYSVPEYQPPAWSEEAPAFDHEAAAEDDSPPRPQPVEKGGKLWVWIGVGASLQVLAVLMWVYFFIQPGCSSTPDAPAKKPTPKKTK